MVSRRQIKHAIQILSQASEENFLELKKEIQNSITSARAILKETEKKIKALSHDQGKSQSLFGFTEKYVKDLKINHPDSVKSFIHNWCQRQSDWRFPWCWIIANDLKYLEVSIKSHLVYVCVNNITEIDIKTYVKKTLLKEESSNPKMFRIKPLQFTGHINDANVPHNQMGTFISIDFLPYISLEQTQNFISSINQVLRPGGQALVHFSDGDGLMEWQSVLDHKQTFINESIIHAYASQVGLTTNFYHVDDFYSFVVLSKPGEKQSIKKGITKIERIIPTK